MTWCSPRSIRCRHWSRTSHFCRTHYDIAVEDCSAGIEEVVPQGVVTIHIGQSCINFSKSHVTAAAFGSGAWIVQQRAARTAEFGDMTSVLEIKLAPFHEMVAVMLLLTALAHAWLAVKALRRSEGRP